MKVPETQQLLPNRRGNIPNGRKSTFTFAKIEKIISAGLQIADIRQFRDHRQIVLILRAYLQDLHSQ